MEPVHSVTKLFQSEVGCWASAKLPEHEKNSGPVTGCQTGGKQLLKFVQDDRFWLLDDSIPEEVQKRLTWSGQVPGHPLNMDHLSAPDGKGYGSWGLPSSGHSQFARPSHEPPERSIFPAPGHGN